MRGQQRALDRLAVGILRRGVELVALVQAVGEVHWRVADAEVGAVGELDQRVEPRQQFKQRATFALLQGLQMAADECGLGVDEVDIAGVALVAHGPADDGQREQSDHAEVAGDAEPALAPFGAAIAPGQVRFREDDLVQQVLQEVALAALRCLLQRYAAVEAEAAVEAAEQAVERRAFLCAAREVHAAQHRGRRELGVGEHVL